MSSRRADDTPGGVLSFTFLDVLTCTMGTLVLLLVVFGERAKHAAFAEMVAQRVDAVAASPPPGGAAPNLDPVLSAEEAALQLAEVRAQQNKLDKLRADVAERMREEQARVAHLEDHERRLEHELAKLHFTLERLDEAEQKLQVDQEGAKRNLERLTGLVQDAEQQIEEAKKQQAPKRSYAIVPYKGANGTFRRPIYVECTKDAVIIQPEGIRLIAADFDGPLRSGNPLAAAVRAAREELNSRTETGDASELPDPYPLLVVRPDGAAAYSAALSAISSWDADYGYEFVDADWNLEFPTPDARLGQVMAHAVDQARARQALLAKAAPRRYATRLKGGARGTGSGGGNGEGDDAGFDALTQIGGAGDRIGQHTGEGQFVGEGARGDGRGGNSPRARYGELTAGSAAKRGGDQGDFADQFASEGGAASAGAASGVPGGQAGPAGAEAVGAEGGAKAAGEKNAFATAGTGYSASAAGASGTGAEPPPNVHAPATMAPTGAAGSAANHDNSSAGAPQMAYSGDRSAAESRGANWANSAASQKSSPISRPIKVIVAASELALLPEGSGDAADATTVTFRQPTGQVLDQLATAVQSQIKSWGLAGRAMYWRPNLVLQIAPGGERQAARLAELLEDSGIDVRMPQTAVRPAEDGVYGR